MEKFTCMAKLLIGKNKKHKKSLRVADESKKSVSDGKTMVNAINFSIPSIENSIEKFNFTFSESFSPLEKRSSLIPNVPSSESLARTESAGEASYEGGDEHDEIQSMKRDNSDLDLQDKGELVSHGSNTDLNDYVYKHKFETNEGFTLEAVVASGHVSDPGMECTYFQVSPVLKRSCSNIESKRASKSIKSMKSSNSYVSLTGNFGENFLYEAHSSPLSVKYSCSADRGMLKKSHSCQVLPSQSRKIFLQCHRNLHKPSTPQLLASFINTANQKVGYSSDTYGPVQKYDKKNKAMETENKWVAFSLLSCPKDRVDAWVNSLEDCTTLVIDDEETCNGKEDEGTADRLHMEIGETSGKNLSLHSQHAEKETMQANHIIQSLNFFSTAAHISGMGLKVIPSMSAFGSLRCVYLSGNFIVQIAPRSLPKNLHTLDLSRNKLSTTEGLRELTRLRVLNLSYNRISRIGRGLSNCTVIKELYLAGNKISDVEGLHRLLKLALLDLSFNKIITAKTLGQLVANYHSLLALNLIGNPIQSNIGDDQVKKAVLSLLPNITYLNKQPIKQDRVREAAVNSIAKAALRDEGSNHHRRPVRRLRHTKNKPKSNMGLSS